MFNFNQFNNMLNQDNTKQAFQKILSQKEIRISNTTHYYTDDEISKSENKLGFKLPYEFKIFLSLLGDGYLYKNNSPALAFEYTKKVQSENRNLEEVLCNSIVEVFNLPNSTLSFIEDSEYYNNFAIVSTPLLGTTYLVLHKNGNVCLYDYDYDSMTLLANSWFEFLENLH